MFKTENFFNAENVTGLKSHAKTYSPVNSKLFNTLN